MLGVCIKTLRRWEKKRKITCVRTLGGHRRFPVQEIKRLILKSSYKQEISHPHSSFKSTCAIYGRVSSHKQSKRGDLERQVEQLKEHAKKIGLI
ncbi:MAG: recombinase family protein [Candidatus Lokiarchaeota archaeon]|nr:recombinase family protein [Candidatus Lokiarchaeota archaeon]